MLLSVLMFAALQDGEAAGNLSKPAAPATNPGSWMTNVDYPATAMREGREGTTGFRLAFGADGLPTSCEITAPSGHSDLDGATCRLAMARARFTPGRNAQGEATGGTYVNRIRWQIPDGYLSRLASAGFSIDESGKSWPRGPSPLPVMLMIDAASHYPAAAREAKYEGAVHLAISVDAWGKVTGCSIIDSSMSAELDAAACAVIRKNGAFEPALDSAGKATNGVVPAVFQWILPRDDVDTASGTTRNPVEKFPFSKPADERISVHVDAEGAVSRCTFSGTADPARFPAGASPCDMFGDAQRYIPFVDASGKAVAKRITFRTELKIEDASNASSTAR